jgi:uncharacterized membrane protein YoaK (UPF0700 family)
MKSVPADAARDVLLLCLAAGSADAAGYIGLGRVFTSNMTGNVVLLGVAIGQGHVDDVVRSIFVLIVFMLGVALGVWLGRLAREGDWAGLVAHLVRCEKILLLLFAIGWLVPLLHQGYFSFALLGTLACAMGLQSAALSRLAAPGVGTTAITGTITALVTGVVVRVADPAQASSRQRLAFQAAVLAVYCSGAAISGILLMLHPAFAGWVPIAAAVCVRPSRAKAQT